MARAQMTKIKVGYSSIGVGQSLVWVAKEAGLFKENGLDLQLIFIGSSSIVTQAVIAGDVPIQSCLEARPSVPNSRERTS